MYAIRRGSEWLAEYATGGYYWTGPGMSGGRHWCAKFAPYPFDKENPKRDLLAGVRKVADAYGGVIEKL